MSDITIGQYYSGTSLLHQLDARVKLLGTVLFSIAVFLVDNPLGYALIFFAVVVMVALSHVPITYIVKTVYTALLFALFISVFQIFFAKGNAIVSLGWLQITDQGVISALKLSFRLVILILGTSLVTFCTTPKDLTNGLEKGLGFLRVFHVPVSDIATAMFIAIRFIPVLSDEMSKIRTAQISRGADFDQGGPIKRITNLMPLIVPLLVSSFQRAYDLSIAMEARCYCGVGKTKMYPFVYSTKDYVAYVVIGAFTVLVVVATYLLSW